MSIPSFTREEILAIFKARPKSTDIIPLFMERASDQAKVEGKEPDAFRATLASNTLLKYTAHKAVTHVRMCEEIMRQMHCDSINIAVLQDFLNSPLIHVSEEETTEFVTECMTELEMDEDLARSFLTLMLYTCTFATPQYYAHFMIKACEKELAKPDISQEHQGEMLDTLAKVKKDLDDYKPSLEHYEKFTMTCMTGAQISVRGFDCEPA